MDWFLYDNGLRHERVELQVFGIILFINFAEKKEWFDIFVGD